MMNIRRYFRERRAERAMQTLVRMRGHAGAIRTIQHQLEQVEASDLFTSPSPPLTDKDGYPTQYALHEIQSVMAHDEQLAVASTRHRDMALTNSVDPQAVKRYAHTVEDRG